MTHESTHSLATARQVYSDGAGGSQDQPHRFVQRHVECRGGDDSVAQPGARIATRGAAVVADALLCAPHERGACSAEPERRPPKGGARASDRGRDTFGLDDESRGGESAMQGCACGTATCLLSTSSTRSCCHQSVFRGCLWGVGVGPLSAHSRQRRPIIRWSIGARASEVDESCRNRHELGEEAALAEICRPARDLQHRLARRSSCRWRQLLFQVRASSAHFRSSPSSTAAPDFRQRPTGDLCASASAVVIG